MSSRRSEIEAKRQRLAELRRQREEKEKERERERERGREHQGITPEHTPQPQSSRPLSPSILENGDRENIDNLVEQLVGEKSRQRAHRSISIQTENVIIGEITGTEKNTTYNKSTQTDVEVEEVEDDDENDKFVDSRSQVTTAGVAEDIEQEEEQGEEDHEPLNPLATVEDSVLSSFLSKSFKIINRAIEEDSNHDILQTYAQKKKQALEESEPYLLLDTLQFDEPVRSVDTSPFFPDLIIISTGLTVRLYNTAFHTYEYQFDSQTNIIHVQFSQYQSNFIFGTGYNGKLHIWDLESTSKLPYLTSMVTSSTHSYPVFAMDQIQENNGIVIVTSSTDGKILHWDPQILSRPSQPAIQLKVPKSLSLRYDQLTPWCMTHSHKDSGFLLVGCEDGNIYKVKRFDHKVNGDDALDLIFNGHVGPVTGIDSSLEFPQLFVSSGMDWKVFLWDSNVETPLVTIYKSNCIMSCQWRPGHSTQVGYIYEDVFEIMDLSIDCVVPICKLKCGKTLSGFKFIKNGGDKVLLSTVDGELLIYEILLQDVKSDPSKFKRLYVANV